LLLSALLCASFIALLSVCLVALWLLVARDVSLLLRRGAR
jgi:hypothetical protein